MNNALARTVVALVVALSGCAVRVDLDAGSDVGTRPEDARRDAARDAPPDEGPEPDAREIDVVERDVSAPDTPTIDEGTAPDAAARDAGVPDVIERDALTRDSFVAIASIESLDAANCSRGDAFGPYPVGVDLRIQTRSNSRGSNNVVATSELEYTVSDTSIASIDRDGVLSLNAPGTVTVTVRLLSNPVVTFTSRAFSAVAAPLDGIAIGPGQNFELGPRAREIFRITGSFGAASRACPIRSSRGVRWEASPAMTPGWSVDATSGLAEVGSEAPRGAVSVMASYMGRTATARGAIVAGCVEGIELASELGPASVVASDVNIVLTPYALRSDGSRAPIVDTGAAAAVRYSSSNPFTATAFNATTGDRNRAIVTAASPLMPGAVTVTASYAGAGLCAGSSAPVVATHVVTITDAVLRSLSVQCSRPDPAAAGSLVALGGDRLVANHRAICTATGRFSDGSEHALSQLTWRATGPGAVSATGVVTAGAAPGALVVEAQSGSIVGLRTITVVDAGAATLSIDASPPLPTQGTALLLASGTRGRLVATARYTYGANGARVTEQHDASELAEWSSAAPSVVEVDNGFGQPGSVFGGATAGTASVTARVGGASATRQVENAALEARGLRLAFGSSAGSRARTLRVGQRETLSVQSERCPAGVASGGAGCAHFAESASAELNLAPAAIARTERAGASWWVTARATGAAAVRATLGPLSSEAMLTVEP